MENLNLRIRKSLCVINALALLCSPLLLRSVAGQAPDHRGKPVVITFGQPNIWSLDQAHYLLSQLREQSLDFQAARLAELDPNETHGTRVNFMRRVFELAAQFKQPLPSGSPESSPAPAEFPSGTPEKVPSTNVLDGSIISKLLANPEFQKRLFSDPKLNAITKLDNHIQLQYEIIARQLTLLRDEVRPGERLVFLELPQSIYTTDDKANNKMAQVWWQVDGYYRYDAVEELTKAINIARARAADIRQREPRMLNMSDATCSREELDQVCRRRGQDCETQYQLCRTYSELKYWQKSQDDLAKKIDEELTKRDRRLVERLMQEGPADVAGERTYDEKKFEPVRKPSPEPNPPPPAYHHRKVRTVDIIPHQSSLNVNDVQETVKSSFFSGMVAFFSGFGARSSFQKQRDQFEQFLHQDLYASGFGKGDSLFGWTFGPLPGTKRVAPGLRTTFAALIVPDTAETISLRARGCFFSRDDNEPPDAMGQRQGSRWWDNNDRECGDFARYQLSIPSGGGTRNFWVTGIEYKPNKLPNQRMVALIKGENFTTQIGVLIDGVPLRHVVELSRKLPASVKNNSNANCPGICGEYEVIGPGDISIAFEMPENFVGTPEIVIVGPGRSVNLNHIPNLPVQAYGVGRFFELQGSDTPFMFGDGPQVRIGDIKLFRDGKTSILGVLRATRRLTASPVIFINGKILDNTITEAQLNSGTNGAYFDSAKQLVRLRLIDPSDEKLEILILDGTDADTKVVANPFAEGKKPPPLAIADDAVLALDMERGEMAVRLTGTGLAKATLTVLKGASAESEITSQSATEVILRLVDPKIAVRIKLTDPNGDNVTRAIVRRPPTRSVMEKRDVVDTKN